MTKAKRFYEMLRDDLRENLLQEFVVDSDAQKVIRGGHGWTRLEESEDGKWTLHEPEV